ncbi:MAG: branched-chain amino acid aminotransferase [Alphaproteobacteria bacterium]|nr:branched-chain amino acid aminotransferase [Alphaproteobacteria bacterium]
MQPITFVDGGWKDGNAPVMGAMDHGLWLGSVVFDGARAFDGVTPDLDLHCARVIHSAHALGLGPMLSAGEVMDIALDGVAKFPPGSELYIRPLLFAAEGMGHLMADPASTRFALTVFPAALPPPTGFSACLSRFRRPGPEFAPTAAKAPGHYAQGARAVAEAAGKGFDNAVLLDPLGHVAELATANLFLAKDGVAVTPAENGTFLNGITRRRVIGLLRESGTAVEERAISPEELAAADEIFSTGNWAKVVPLNCYESRALPPGPVFRRAREAYWDFAHSRRR